MDYKKIIFLKKDNKLVGIGIKNNGSSVLLTLEEAVKAASELKKNNREDAIEYPNTKRELKKAKTEMNSVRSKRFNTRGILAASMATILAISGATYSLSSSKGKIMSSVKASVSSTNTNNDGEDIITIAKKRYDEMVNKTLKASADEEVIEEEYDDEEYEEEAAEKETEDFNTLLESSESYLQQRYVGMMADYINYFNDDFANTYKETVDGIVIKPALSWNYEIAALTIAYNDLSKNEILQIFNGAEFNANTLDSNYKNATLQLMGAYTISESSKPVKLYNLIESEEGKAFIKKYENMFYAIKDAKTSEARIDALNDFFAELYKDYPIDTETREYGIAHMDARSLMDNASYKLAVTPMVAAIEISYQNELVDVTLSSKAIDYFNDLGMCNIAYEKFQKVEFTLEDSKYDTRYADFVQLSKIIIANLKSNDNYVIDDSHRELSKLDKFQKTVNGHFEVEVDEHGNYTGSYSIGGGSKGSSKTTTTTKRRKVKEWTKTDTKTTKETKKTYTEDREKAVKKTSEKEVKAAEDKVKKEIEKENKKNKEAAEKKANKEQKKQQAEENKKAEEKKKQAKEANENVDKGIEGMNKTTNENNKDHDKSNNKPVKPADGVTINDEHKDSNGNVNDSVKDITKDGNGAGNKLPKPEETEEEFNKRTESKSSSNSDSSKSESKKEEPKKEEPKKETPKAEPKKEEPKKETPKAEPKKEEPKKEESKPNLPDPEETGKEFDEKANNNIKSQEELVDLYIERMASLNITTPVKAKTKVLRG